MSLIQRPNTLLKGLPVPPYVTAFRILDQQLRTDPRISSIVKPTSFWSWTGTPEEWAMPSFDQCPFIRLNPMLEASPFSANDSTLMNFRIEVELYTAGTCWDDLAAFWNQVYEAIYLRNTASTSLMSRLQLQANALSGLVIFGAFRNDPSPAIEGPWRGVGSLSIQIRVSAIN